MHRMLKSVHLSEVSSHMCVFEWFKMFLGREVIVLKMTQVVINC